MGPGHRLLGQETFHLPCGMKGLLHCSGGCSRPGQVGEGRLESLLASAPAVLQSCVTVCNDQEQLQPLSAEHKKGGNKMHTGVWTPVQR